MACIAYAPFDVSGESFYAGRATLHWTPSTTGGSISELVIGAINETTLEQVDNLGRAISDAIGAEVVDARLVAGHRVRFFVSAVVRGADGTSLVYRSSQSGPIVIGANKYPVRGPAQQMVDAVALKALEDRTWPSKHHVSVMGMTHVRGLGLLRVPRLAAKAAAQSRSLYNSRRDVINTSNAMRLIMRFATPYCTPTNAESHAVSLACRECDVTGLDGWLHGGIDPNHCEEGGVKLLRMAVECRNVPVVRRLIAAGADVNSDESRYSLLHVAARKGFVDVVDVLIDAGANVNKRVNRLYATCTPLFIAAGYGHLPVVERLIAASADMEIGAAVGNETPLFIAASRGHVGIVEALIVAGAQLNKVVSLKSCTALYVAASKGNANVVHALIKAGADVDARRCGDIYIAQESYIGSTPLWIAVYKGHVEIVKALIEADADVNKATIKDNKTPLWVAAGGDNDEIIKALVDAGADKSIRDDDPLYDISESPLEVAIAGGRSSAVALLR